MATFEALPDLSSRLPQMGRRVSLHIFECSVTREWHCLRRTRKCGLVRGSMPLGASFEVSEAHTRLNMFLSFSSCGSGCSS